MKSSLPFPRTNTRCRRSRRVHHFIDAALSTSHPADQTSWCRDNSTSRVYADLECDTDRDLDRFAQTLPTTPYCLDGTLTILAGCPSEVGLVLGMVGVVACSVFAANRTTVLGSAAAVPCDHPRCERTAPWRQLTQLAYAPPPPPAQMAGVRRLVIGSVDRPWPFELGLQQLAGVGDMAVVTGSGLNFPMLKIVGLEISL